MKSFFDHIRHFLINSSLVITALSFPAYLQAESDSTLDAQRISCAKNSASEWSEATNKCVAKVAARDTRHAVEDCGTITDPAQKSECFKKIAETKTGLSSDVDSLPTDGTNKSAVMNGIVTAYAMIGLINSLAGGNEASTCTSKKIFAVTGLAGTASDIWLKIQAKKKLNALKDKYKLNAKDPAYDTQVKAFQYLKEEQETIKSIASNEKKRNMLLMLGYGAASLMAIYEMTPYGQNPGCYQSSQSEAKPSDKPKVDPLDMSEETKDGVPEPVDPAPPSDTQSVIDSKDVKCPNCGLETPKLSAEFDGTLNTTAPEVPAPVPAPAPAAPAPAPAAPAPAPAAPSPAPAAPPKAVTATPQTTEIKTDSAPKPSFVASGTSPNNTRIQGVDANGKPNGTFIGTVTKNGKKVSGVFSEATGKRIGPIPADFNLKWKDGRSAPLPTNIIGKNSGAPRSMNFNGKKVKVGW